MYVCMYMHLVIAICTNLVGKLIINAHSLLFVWNCIVKGKNVESPLPSITESHQSSSSETEAEVRM